MVFFFVHRALDVFSLGSWVDLLSVMMRILIICRNVERGGEVVEAGDARDARQRDQEEHCGGSFGTYVDTFCCGKWGVMNDPS